MITSVTGFPRIGKLRELKFAEEKYFRGEIDRGDLEKVAGILKSEHWRMQNEAGIDLISCNDFSYYDIMLDTAALFNIIPKRFSELLKNDSFDELDLYFAMARGFQGEAGDVPALAMKKWFNTNYHYIVPEIDDSTDIRLSGSKPVDEYKEAAALGFSPKVNVIGPFTFLRLTRNVGTKNVFTHAAKLIAAYKELFYKLSEAGATWIQIEEPCLVCDIDDEHKKYFCDIYKELLSEKKGLKLLLSTYFGDVRDVYDEICALDFDGIALDFCEGRKNRDLIKEKGFPEDKKLFAGVINGKNIWKSNYANVIGLLDELSQHVKTKAITTSCSLLHVPYSLENEKELDDGVRSSFAFALEKLTELRDVADILVCENREKEPAYSKNWAHFTGVTDREDKTVRQKVNVLKETDFVRLPERSQRESIQRKELALSLLPTTTIGSFPQTKAVKANRSAFRKGEITKEQYDERVYDFIKECIRLQEKIGLDVLVHGEYERNDMVEFFGENLEGFVFTKKAWVQSYGTRCVKPPIIYSDISRKCAITSDYITFAQSLTKKKVKGMLTGPVTILNWSFPREDISLKESAFQIALAIREEVLELEEKGIRIIQIDEAALREKLPLRKSDWHSEYLEWAIPAFRLCHSGVRPETQIHTHMCYSEFNDIIRDIDDLDADVISFEASRSDLTILVALEDSGFETQVGPGVYDIHSPRVPSVEEIESALNKMLDKIDKTKLWVNPDCGLKTRGEEETVRSLENLVKAAANVRSKIA